MQTMAAKAHPVIMVCAWCPKSGIDLTGSLITHGICKAHADQMLALTQQLFDGVNLAAPSMQSQAN